MPAFKRDGAGTRWHLRPVVPSAAVPASHFTGAAESLVSFIPLFAGVGRRLASQARRVGLCSRASHLAGMLLRSAQSVLMRSVADEHVTP